MGQVISYLWKCIRPNKTPTTITTTTTTATLNLQNEQISQVEEQQTQSHYINIQDEEEEEEQVEKVEKVIQDEEEEQVEKVIQVVVTKDVPVTIQTTTRTSQVLLDTNSSSSSKPINYHGITKQLEAVGRIGAYNSKQRILLVGEGDFSFSTSLAIAFGSASNIIATSLDTHEFLTRNYRNFLTNKKELEIRGAMVIHGINATNMAQQSVLWSFKFDCIIYNFPHAGCFGATDADMRKNQDLVRGFLRNAKQMLNGEGEIHIAHKTTRFFSRWDIPKIGVDEGLHLIQEAEFRRTMFPGYRTNYGFGSVKDFNWYPSKTYKFGLYLKPI